LRSMLAEPAMTDIRYCFDRWPAAPALPAML
jgi:hypothetical protein